MKTLWRWKEFWNFGAARWLLSRIKCLQRWERNKTQLPSVFISGLEMYFLRRTLSDQRDNFKWRCQNETVNDLLLQDRHIRIRQNLGTFAQTFLPWKSIKCYILWGCVWSLRYPAFKGTCPIFSSVACPALHLLSTLSHKRHDFRKKVTECKMCVLISSTTFAWNIYHYMKNWVKCYLKYIFVIM
jgi:hypothetical protein